MDADTLACACCQDKLQDGTEAQALVCGHVFHKECINNYMEVAGFASLEDVPCPNCKKDFGGMQEMEQRAGLISGGIAAAAPASNASSR